MQTARAASKELASARSVFAAWEWLRLYYNGTLVLVVLLTGWPNLAETGFWMFLTLCAAAANVCFCVGPVAEGYLALMIEDRLVPRYLVFTGGLLLSCLLAFLCVLTWNMKGFD